MPVGDHNLALVGQDVYFATVLPEFSLWAVRGITGDQPKAERVYRPKQKEQVSQVASDGQLITVTVGAELRGSRDGGRNWTVLRRDPDGKPLRELQFAGGKLYVNTYENLDGNTDGGSQWTRRPVPAPGEGVTDIADPPTGAGKPAITLVSAVYRGRLAGRQERLRDGPVAQRGQRSHLGSDR